MNQRTFARHFVILLFILLSALHAYAQNGTVYSRFGLGEIRYMPNSRTVGMGFAGTAMADSLYINRVNPASLAFITSTRVSGDFTYNGYTASTADASSLQVLAGFEGIGAAVPIGPGALAVGLYPYSTMAYSFSDVRSFRPIDFPDSVARYEYIDKGQGGLNEIPISFGIKAFDDDDFGRLNVGVSYNFMFGLLERTIENLFPQNLPGGAGRTGLLNARRIEEDRMNGRTVSLGVHYLTGKELLGEDNSIGLAFSYTTEAVMDNKNIVKSVYWLPSSPNRGVTSLTTDTVIVVAGTSTLPARFQAGLALSFGRIALAVDGVYQQWERFSLGVQDVSFRRNAYRLGGGVEYLPTRELRASYLEKMHFRAGVYYHQTEWGFESNPINELGVTFGTSLPLQNEISRADINVLFASRGATTNGFLRETILRITLSMNFGEKWFIERIIE